MSGVLYRVGIDLKEVNEAFNANLSESDLERFLEKSEFNFTVVNSRDKFLSSIKSVVGKPYKRGASVLRDAPNAFDCSSLVSWAAVEAGLSIPRISIDQYVYSERIDKNDILPGDLVFANTKEIIHTDGRFYSKVLEKFVEEQPIRTETLEYKPGTKVQEGIDHVGIYIGNNHIIHSSTKTGGVVEEVIDQSNSFKNIVGYGNIFSNNDKRFVIKIPEERNDMRTKDGLLKELIKLWQIKE
jgi:hypothetical protein